MLWTGAGSGTLVGRFQIGHTTATVITISLVFWRGIKPTLGGNHGAILYENGGFGASERHDFHSGWFHFLVIR